MSSNTKYPKFIVYIGGIILLIIVAFALISNQNIRKIAFPGGEVQFEQPQPKDETIRFAVIHDTTHEVLPVRYQTAVYIDGKISAKLVVEPKKRIATASIVVSKPGTYSYVLEQELQTLFTDPDNDKLYPSSYKKQLVGRGKINVKQGEAFIVGRGQDVNGKVRLILRSLEEDETARKKEAEMILKGEYLRSLEEYEAAKKETEMKIRLQEYLKKYEPVQK